MSTNLPYDIHEMIIEKHIKTYADFMRFLVLVNNMDTAKILIKRFSNTFNIHYFHKDIVPYTYNHVPIGKCVELRVYTISKPIPFFANVTKISIMNGVFDPAMYINYAHLTNVDIYHTHKLDWKLVAQAFPNLRKMDYIDAKNVENAVTNIPTLKYINLFCKTDYKKFKNIQFSAKINDLVPIDEPNVKFILHKYFDDLDYFYPIADKIVAIRIEISMFVMGPVIIIPNIFSAITHLFISNKARLDIVLSGFPNLDTIILTSPPSIKNKIFISDIPFLNRFHNYSNYEIIHL